MSRHRVFVHATAERTHLWNPSWWRGASATTALCAAHGLRRRRFWARRLVGANFKVFVLNQNLQTANTVGLNHWRDLRSATSLAVAAGPLGTGTTGGWMIRSSDNRIMRQVR